MTRISDDNILIGEKSTIIKNYIVYFVMKYYGCFVLY